VLPNEMPGAEPREARRGAGPLVFASAAIVIAHTRPGIRWVTSCMTHWLPSGSVKVAWLT
jgi:hypothetical protein